MGFSLSFDPPTPARRPRRVGRHRKPPRRSSALVLTFVSACVGFLWLTSLLGAVVVTQGAPGFVI